MSASTTRRRIAAMAGVVLALVVSTAAPAHASSGVLDTRLTGAAEVPGPGDTDGSGRAIVIVDTSHDLVCAILWVSRVDTPTAAHIHAAPAGVAGPVVVTLKAPANGRSFTCASVSGSLANQLANQPSNYYVNVHNADFPGGAVRGQLAGI